MQSSLENRNEFVFTIETNIKNVMNTLEILTLSQITDAQIRYIDEYGYEKVANLLNVENVEKKKILTFQHFYTNKFDLVLFGDIAQESIEDLKIIPLNQNEFYEDKDIDVRLDKTGLTAISLCGQYSSDAPANAIDGNEAIVFHSAKYTGYAPGTYGDFVVELGKEYLLDRLKLSTRGSGNGRIKAYEVLYRTSKSEDWKKIFEQLTEESGVNREAVFKPVLASEICIRTTNGHGSFVFIGELDLFKYNFIESRIKNLFANEEETILKAGVTLEEIETLQSELSTNSYKERVAVAKELYILGLPQNNFSIPLNGEKIFDKIQFTTTERVLRTSIKYIDVYGNEITVPTDFESSGTLYTLNINKIMTSSATIVVYGVSSIENISINNYEKSEFYIDEDVDLRIPFQKMIASTTNPNNSYPISNMFDGNWNSQFHCTQYGEYCDIYFKLDKEYLIDKLNLVSYRSNTSGLINRFKVLVKEMNNDNSWAELGAYTVDSYANKWLELKNSTPYLTNEVCVRIEDSVNKWALICELELFIHSNLEKEINELYSDNTYTSLREGVTYEEILALEAKNLVTPDFVEKIEKAKELYIVGLPQNHFSLGLTEQKIFDKIQFLTSERVLRAHIKYVDSYGVERLIESNFETLGNIYTLNINKIQTSDASLVLYGISKIDGVSTNSYEKSEFYIDEDVDLRIASEKIVVTTERPNSSYPYSNLFDGDLNSQFHCNQNGDYCDIFFKLDKPYLMDRLRLVSYRSNTSGLINEFKVLLKEMNTVNNWVELGDYKVDSYANKWLEVKGNPYLTDEVCLRVESSVNGWTLINELELLIHSNLEKDIRDLFSDKECTILKDSITYDELLTLESRVLITEEYRELVLRAKELYLDKQPDLNFVLETDKKMVMNQIKVETTGKIYKTEITYNDEHNNTIVLEATEIENRGEEIVLTFPNFYCDNFNLMIDGDITEDLIQNIKITQLNQNNFFEEKDVDVRLNKSELTTISHCGQHADNSPDKAIDGDNETYFHSSTYSGSYGDFVIELGKEYVVDRLRFITRADNEGQGNGRIRAYEVLYKNSGSTEWKKVFEQLSDQSGNDREAVFKAVLASEICIRVTNGKNKYVVVKELDIFKYNYIDEKISNLFTDKTEVELKSTTTLEEIEALEKEIKTEAYLVRVQKAKELYITNLPQNEFVIPLENQKIFDRVQFITSERVLRAHIKYTDVYGEERLVQSEFEALGNIYTLNIQKVMTSSATLIVYGVSSIGNIFTNSYAESDFYVDGDIDSRISSDKIVASSVNGHASYPETNLFDGNLDSQYRSSHFTDSQDIYLKLDKEYLIDRLRLLSYRSSPTSGLVTTFKVLLKEMNSSDTWIELGEHTVDSYTNTWREVKGKPFLTDEVCIRITDSVDKWVILNEVELFIHNKLEKEIDDLFTDNTFEELKAEVTYAQILDLEARVLVTPEYKEKVDKAKALYLAKTIPLHFTLEIDEKNVMNSLKVLTEGKIYFAEISYVDAYGYNKKANLLDIESKALETLLTFEHFYSDKFNLTVRGDITESQIQNIRIVQLNQNEFYESKDIDVRLDKTLLTAVSYCGQYSDNAPSHAIDGDVSTGFHSATYSEYGDFAIELDKPYLLDRLQMITRSSGNGRIKAYEVLYRNSKTENWKKIFEQLTEESGTGREATFKPVLATEICIRVTNGHGRFVLIHELDLFKYNTLEKRISNLFLDENEDMIKPGVTLEEIETLERELKTSSYKERVAKAKQLFIDGLLAKEFLVPLSGMTILDRVKFKTEERVSKVRVKYLDSYSVEKIIDVNCASVGDGYVLSFEKIVTEKMSILMYGAENINSIVTNSYDVLDFSIGEDVDLRIPYENIIDSSTTNPNNSYPISNMFDNNMDSQFHCSQYGDYCDVYFKLDKEYFIDALALKSYRSNESGLINRFRVLLKDMNSENSWTELGDYIVDSYKNEWLRVEGNPYLTNEVCLRIEDSVNGWALVNELEIFIHSQLGVRIDNLFSDNTFEELRAGVTYSEILELAEKAITTIEFKEKVKKAKDLYLSSCIKKNYKLNYKYDFIVDELELVYKTGLTDVVDYKLEYVTTLGEKVEIDKFEVIQKNEKSYSLKFDTVLTKNIELTISYIDGTEAWKSSYIKVVEIDQTPYYVLDDRSLEYDRNLITPISHCGIYNSANGVENMLDGDLSTLFHSKTTGKVEFKLSEPKVINEFWADISHPNGDNGKINKAKFYYKEKEDGDWIFVQNYENESPRSGVNTFTFPNILAHSFCIDVEACYAGVVIFNEIGINIYSTLAAKVNNLFVDDTMFKALKKDINLSKIEKLKVLVKESKDLKIKLEIASMIVKNNGEFPLKVQTYKAIENDSSYYFGATVSNNTGNIVLSSHYIQPNIDYVFVLNREVQVALMTYTGKPSSNKTFILKKGINLVNIPEQGQMIFRGSRKEEIEYYSLNNENALIYRYGHTKSEDFFNKNDIKNELEKDHNSNLAYVEGKTYIGAISFDWLKANFESKNLSKHIEIFDEYLDFIHYLDNVTGHFKQQMPYKRLLWCGRGEDTFHAGGSFIGGYTAYYGSSGPMIPKSTYDLANSWAVGHELGHELDSNDYIMGIFGEVTNNWFAEQPRQEFMKTIRTIGNVKNISENPYSVYEMGFFDRLAFFYKMRLFYTDNSFFQKMNALMQANRASSLEEAADNYAKFSTQILKRDMSSYYLKYGFELSEEAIAWCNQYPAPAIDLQHITWENHEEFVKEEIKLFNQKYKSVSKIK